MNKIIVLIIAAVVSIGGYWWWGRGEKAALAPPGEVELDSAKITPETMETRMISYTDNGYAPAALTIKTGETVTFSNKSAKFMWPASAMHPTHRVYGGTELSEHCPDPENDDFDACTSILPDGSWSFTFNKAGEWKYHDHLSPTFFGAITVE